MYKVFVNDKPINLTDSLKNDNNFSTVIFKDIVVDEIIYKIKNGRLKGINLYVLDLEIGWSEFKNKFKTVEAGGGLVLNSEKEILFIYRARKWDLPKGRIEKEEEISATAIREVKEESAISNLEIIKPLLKTYHIFYQNKKRWLKETHWYLMHSTYKGELKPQIEEGIFKAEFKNVAATKKALQNTYQNILSVYEAYKSS